MADRQTFFCSDHELSIIKEPYKVGGRNEVNSKKFGSDRVLTPEKAPYKVRDIKIFERIDNFFWAQTTCWISKTCLIR